MANIKKKIILVVTKSGYWEANETYGNFMPPVGILAVASFLIGKYEIEIIDQRFKGWRELLKAAMKDEPLFIGLSFMTGEQIKFALEACKFIKENSNIKIVAGGIHPTLAPEETLANGSFDYLILGEGEQTVACLADALADGGNIEGVEGIAFIKDGKYIKTQQREQLDINRLPPLPYYLLNKKLSEYSYVNKYGLLLETSRGCPFKCNYCYNAIYNRGSWRKKTPENVVKDIKYYIERYGVDHFHILDDNFFVDLQRAKEIMRGLVALDKNLNMEFQGVRADSICNMDEETFSLFKKLGGTSLRVGIETGSQRILDLINKNTTVEKSRLANKILAEHKIKSYYNFMVGFPFETTDDLKKTTNFAVELMADNPSARIDFLAIYQPYPGTVLFNECVKEGYFKVPEKLEGWSKLNWDEVNLTCFSDKRKRLLKNIHISSYALLIRKNSKLEPLPLPLKFLARMWSYVQKLRMKYFIFNFFWIEIFFYNYGKKIFDKKDHLVE